MKFRVKWEWNSGEKGIAEESSWYLLTQTGKLLNASPMKPIKEVDIADYKELTPMIEIKGKWMSISDIETIMDDLHELAGGEGEFEIQ